MLRPEVVGLQHDRHGDVDGGADLQSEKVRRRDADDRHPVGAHLDGFAQDGGIQAESSRPEGMTDDGDRAVGPAAPEYRVVARREHATVHRLDAEHVEITAGRVLAEHLLGRAVDRHLDRPLMECRNTGEEAIVIAKRFVTWIRRPAAAAGLPARVVDEEEVLRVRDRQELHEYRVDQAEDRGVRADAEAERQQRDERERR